MCFLNFNKFLKILLTFIIIIFGIIKCQVVDITDANHNQYITDKYEVVFVNFHAEWCRFSQILTPIFRDAAQAFATELNGTDRVLFARVNCDENPILYSRYKISKYPTLKVFLNGFLMKKEYRGQRTKEAFIQFVKDLLTDSVIHIDYKVANSLSALKYNTSAVIGYYNEYPKDNPKYETFRKVAADMRGYCEFYWVTGSPFIPKGKSELLAFKPSKSTKQHEYDFTYEDHHELSSWSIYLCLPLVKEITFENAEEIIEEGLPLVILFHLPEDEESPKLFKEVVHRELLRETSSVVFITADADLFDHPLDHINRTKQDLPLITIDSFKHMYLFPNYSDLNKTGVLLKFIEDLHSGKLHREYHFGADVVVQEEVVTQKVDEEVNSDENYVQEVRVVDDVDNLEEEDQTDDPTFIVDSVFTKLGPSQHRYTLINKDEL